MGPLFKVLSQSLGWRADGSVTRLILPGSWRDPTTALGHLEPQEDVYPQGAWRGQSTKKSSSLHSHHLGFLDGSVIKNMPANAGDVWDVGSILGLIPGSRSSPGGGNGNPLQYSLHGKCQTEEPGGLQSMGSQRVGQDWVTKKQQEKAVSEDDSRGACRWYPRETPLKEAIISWCSLERGQ